MKTKDLNITLKFRELGMFVSIMFSKGMDAVEDDKEYMEVK